MLECLRSGTRIVASHLPLGACLVESLSIWLSAEYVVQERGMLEILNYMFFKKQSRQ